MRAILLAAGLGTRLKPHTEILPKPLFPVGGLPILDRLIHQLAAQGIEAILLNTHHLAPLVEDHIRRQSWPVPVFCRREERLLDTGGAIANMKDFFKEDPMLVMNADIRMDLDLPPLWAFHREKKALATLALLPSKDLNHVALQKEEIAGFRDDPVPQDSRRLAFTGIQILSPEALAFFPKGRIFSSIEAYRAMILAGKAPFGFCLAPASRWSDLGTPETFTDAALETLLTSLHKKSPVLHKERLCGDGSDRRWWRIRWADGSSLIVADHGIQGLTTPSEATACLALGKHLAASGIPVPAIPGQDLFAGLVAMEDLGDTRLHDLILQSGPKACLPYYEKIIALFPAMKKAASGFIPEMAFTFPLYDRKLILERECGYFERAFLRNDLGLDSLPAGLSRAFLHLAEKTLENGCLGLMHRDLQSRNIMIHEGFPRIIDFQGAMAGPLQYDLAALLLDPYADLPSDMRETLFEKTKTLMAGEGVCPESFRKGYTYAALCRNLQILGAFSFLSREKGKVFFKEFIPKALSTLLQQKAFEDKVLSPIEEAARMAQKALRNLSG
jgi:aminoglycoside/choline kinase family phosphotransferase/dTDP-glucose pyrophosphorylase